MDGIEIRDRIGGSGTEDRYEAVTTKHNTPKMQTRAGVTCKRANERTSERAEQTSNRMNMARTAANQPFQAARAIGEYGHKTQKTKRKETTNRQTTTNNKETNKKKQV